MMRLLPAALLLASFSRAEFIETRVRRADAVDGISGVLRELARRRRHRVQPCEEADVPRKPNLPDQFSAFVWTVNDFGPTKGLKSNATLYYDKDKRMESIIGERVSLLPIGIPATISQSTYADATGTYFSLNDVCRRGNGKFSDKWGWLAVAKYGGNDSFKGEIVETWHFTSQKANLTLFSVGDEPRLYSYSVAIELIPGKPAEVVNSTEVYINITAGPPPADKLAKPKDCTGATPVCNSTSRGKSIARQEHYLAHPPGLYNISNQNTADVLGDTVFTCMDVSTGGTKMDHYGVISHYVIAVDTRYGEYSLCNGHPGVCVGYEYFHVGREASIGAGYPNGGQCSDNDDIGSWFSLPSRGRCDSMSALEKGECTWFVEKRVKTVNITCPFDTHKMLQACTLRETPVFSTAQAIFSKAFSSDDESQGGCKDLGGPPAAEIH